VQVLAAREAVGPDQAEAAAALAAAAGRVLRTAESLRDRCRDATHGRGLLPESWLEDEGLGLADLRSAEPPPALVRCLARAAARARDAWARGRGDLAPTLREPLRGQWVLAELHRALIDRMESSGFRLEPHRARLPPLQRLYTAWRSARRATRSTRR